MIVIRTLGLLFIASAAILVISAALGLEGLAIAMYAVVMLTTPVLVGVPGVALARQLVTRPEHASRELRVMGRVSAVMFVVAGVLILREAVSAASVVLFLVAAAFAAFGSWVITRSWKLPPVVSEEKRRVWPYVPFGLGALVALGMSDVDLSGRFESPTTRAYRTAMKSDLRNVVSAEEAYRDSTGRFGTLRAIQSAGFRPSTFVYIAVTADSTAFRATATHQLVDDVCTIWGGRRPQDPRFVGSDGEPDCRKD